MDIRKLQRAIVDGLEDVKGQDIRVFNTEHLSALFERVIVASGLSNRQTKALAAGVRDKVREKGFRVFSTEGEDNGEWIIVDCGAAVVHIMQPEIRQYYHLEEIWGEKPVRVKLLGQSTGLVKASEPMDEPEPPEVPARPVAASRPVKPRARGTAGAAAKPAAASRPTGKPANKSARKPAGKAAPTRVSASGGAARPAGKGSAAQPTGASRKTPGAARKSAGAARKSSGVAAKSSAPATKAKAVAAAGSGRSASRSGTTARPARPAASSRGGPARPGAAKTPRRSS